MVSRPRTGRDSKRRRQSILYSNNNTREIPERRPTTFLQTTYLISRFQYPNTPVGGWAGGVDREVFGVVVDDDDGDLLRSYAGTNEEDGRADRVF